MQLKFCSKCGQSDVELTMNMTWHDCSVLNCVKCGNRWYVCFKHHKRFSVKSYTRMNNHFRLYHTCTELKDNINTDLANNDSNKNDVFSPILYLDQMSGQYNDLKRDLDHMDRLEENTFQKPKLSNSIDKNNICQYYTDEFKEKGKDIRGLVVNAFKQSDKDSFAQMEEILFHMDMTAFLSKFTLDNQLKIISLVNQSRNIQFHTSRIPRSLKDINSFYIKSQHSIYKNVL